MRFRLIAWFAICVGMLLGCDNDDSSSSTSSNGASDGTLTIVVTNDDGIGAPGIDTLVNTLRDMNGVEIIVVAPAENQSGSSDKTTEEGVTWEASSTTSGYEGTAVDGYPADSVNVALNELGLTPDLVVSGVNTGQNVGPLAAHSGTVGAARTAARAGIPAVAVSAGIGDSADYAAGADLVVAWIEENRAAVLGGEATTEIIISFNVPGCTAGEIRTLVAVPLADSIPSGANPFATDCSVEPSSDPVDDVDAMIKGFAAVTEVPLDL